MGRAGLSWDTDEGRGLLFNEAHGYNIAHLISSNFLLERFAWCPLGQVPLVLSTMRRLGSEPGGAEFRPTATTILVRLKCEKCESARWQSSFCILPVPT